MAQPKNIEVRLSKVYKTSLENEQKLKTYLHERYFSSTKGFGKRPGSLR